MITLCDNGSGSIQTISGVSVCVNTNFTTVPKLPPSTVFKSNTLQHKAVSNTASLAKGTDNIYYCKANGKLGSVTLERKSSWRPRFEWGCSV
jgi:hypothetical protein